MADFLLKTEPSEYSFADLERDTRCTWTGVSNAAALAALRTIRKGDRLFIYHTGAEKAIVGLAKATSSPYEDPDRPGTNAQQEPKFAVVDLAPVARAKTPFSLAEIKADPRFSRFALVRQSRLSVMPVPADLAAILRSKTGL